MDEMLLTVAALVSAVGRNGSISVMTDLELTRDLALLPRAQQVRFEGTGYSLFVHEKEPALRAIEQLLGSLEGE